MSSKQSDTIDALWIALSNTYNPAAIKAEIERVRQEMDTLKRIIHALLQDDLDLGIAFSLIDEAVEKGYLDAAIIDAKEES